MLSGWVLSIFPQESLRVDLDTTARVRVGCCHWMGRTEVPHFWSKPISVLENELITCHLLSALLVAIAHFPSNPVNPAMWTYLIREKCQTHRDRVTLRDSLRWEREQGIYSKDKVTFPVTPFLMPLLTHPSLTPPEKCGAFCRR